MNLGGFGDWIGTAVDPPTWGLIEHLPDKGKAMLDGFGRKRFLARSFFLFKLPFKAFQRERVNILNWDVPEKWLQMISVPRLVSLIACGFFILCPFNVPIPQNMEGNVFHGLSDLFSLLFFPTLFFQSRLFLQRLIGTLARLYAGNNLSSKV